MIDKRVFSHAVTLASAFVANGDIRMGNTTRDKAFATEKVSDLVAAMYSALQEAQKLILIDEENAKSRSADPQSH
jgi:hypothetical protein